MAHSGGAQVLGAAITPLHFRYAYTARRKLRVLSCLPLPAILTLVCVFACLIEIAVCIVQVPEWHADNLSSPIWLSILLVVLYLLSLLSLSFQNSAVS